MNYQIHVEEKPDVDEYYKKEGRPPFITHKGRRYRVHGTTLSWDTFGSSVRIWIPLHLPCRPLTYVLHQIDYKALTKPQRRRFFPLSDFKSIWKSFKLAKGA